MKLSNKAILDLRSELIRIYGTDFELDNEALNDIGLLLLESLKQAIKLKTCYNITATS